jgi:hypothetical protein
VKVNGQEFVIGDAYEAGNDYEMDVKVFGREMADAVRAAQAEKRPRGNYTVTDLGSVTKPIRMTRL